MKMFADDNSGYYPESGGDIYWGAIDNLGTGKPSWMEQIFPYTSNTNIYNCPANVQLPVDMQGPFNYFNGARAAYVMVTNDASVKDAQILYSSAFVLSGDTCGIPNVTAGKVTADNLTLLMLTRMITPKIVLVERPTARLLNSGRFTRWGRTFFSPTAIPSGTRVTIRMK